MIGLEKITLKSERLTYCLAKETDKTDMVEVLAIGEVTKPAGFLPITNVEEMDEFYEGFSKYNSGISLFTNGHYIGYVHVNKYNYNVGEYANKQMVMLGIVIRKEDQNKGYGTEALVFMTNYLKNIFDYVVAGCFEENARSRRMIKKAGYTFLEKYEMTFDELKEVKKVEDYIY